jgi:hypothetical protein
MNFYNQNKTKILTISGIIIGLVLIAVGMVIRPAYDSVIEWKDRKFGPVQTTVEYEGSEVEKAKKAIAKEPAVQEAISDMLTSIYERREADATLKKATGHDARARLSADRLTYKYADLMGEQVATSTKGK